MEQPKKLIEVAMPIKEISEASVHDKYIHHGHISTLHIWWARRPIPVCRAVIFASLVPDPLDEKCPKVFKDAVENLLGKSNNDGDPYQPYDDIPYTSAFDKMEDNLRNRLLMFISKFSNEYINNEKIGKETNVGNKISIFSLIKWESKSDEVILNKARKLIWVAKNCSTSSEAISAEELLNDYDIHYSAIKQAEYKLYSLENRHIVSNENSNLMDELENAINRFLDRMPLVYDPFAGGGAIPLEAARLGCRTFGNDLNPVANIIQKCSVEYPQKFGKPIVFSKKEFISNYGHKAFNEIGNEHKFIQDGEIVAINIENRLSYDIEYYAKQILNLAEKEIGHLYPADKKGVKPVVYYWARVAMCSNPACSAEVPLLRQFYLANKSNKKIFLKPLIDGENIDFEIKEGICNENSWIERANLKCPCCGNITDVRKLKEQFIKKQTSIRLLAVVEEGTNGKEYRLPYEYEHNIKIPNDYGKPSEKLPVNDSQNLKITFWGFPTFGDMFSERQLFALQTLCKKLDDLRATFNASENEYEKSVLTYLALWIDRVASYMTTFGRWIPQNEQLSSVFGKQAIPMVFDFPEVSLFSPSTSGAINQLEWILMYINSESNNPFPATCINASSGDKTQFKPKSITCVVTDPPYYDSIAYADLSDFFYVWLKRNIADLYPFNFSTPQTPKTEECTMLKHYHNGDVEKARNHFENKLLQIFDAMEYQTSDIVSIMFAHQSTEAWTTLCNSILGARMNITGSWAIDSERDTRMIANAGAALQSSVTVSCRPSQRNGYKSYREVRKDVEQNVAREVNNLYRIGFRGADLLTACFGQAVSVFGQYEKVEKADGREVSVAELLEMAKESAFNALLKGFDGDDFTKFYIGWLQLFGFSESDFDDAAKFARVGLTINVSDLFTHNLFIKKGNTQELAGYKERLRLNHRIGEGSHNFIIDFVHKAMALYEGANRNALLVYIAKVAASSDNSFWRVITSLCEILPQGSDDYKQASGLLLNKDSLIRESKNIQQSVGEQGQLF